jgi:hypothetical protein
MGAIVTARCLDGRSSLRGVFVSGVQWCSEMSRLSKVAMRREVLAGLTSAMSYLRVQTTTTSHVHAFEIVWLFSQSLQGFRIICIRVRMHGELLSNSHRPVSYHRLRSLRGQMTILSSQSVEETM